MTALRYALAPLIGRGLAVFDRVTARGQGRFQVIILHDVPESLFGPLADLLAHIARNHGFLTPDEAAVGLEAGRIGRASSRPCLVSVDDGFASSARLGLELMPRFGIKALFFICPGLLDAPAGDQPRRLRETMYRGSSPPEIPRLMTWPQVQSLQAAGHTIGAHGMTHRMLSTMPLEELRPEICDAADVLAVRLGHAPEWYAYAFGGVDSISPAALAVIASRYRYCRSGVRGINVAGRTQRLLFAEEIDPAAPPHYQHAVLQGALDFYYARDRRRIEDYWRTAAPAAGPTPPRASEIAAAARSASND